MIYNILIKFKMMCHHKNYHTGQELNMPDEPFNKTIKVKTLPGKKAPSGHIRGN
jgi:hypothetical protein